MLLFTQIENPFQYRGPSMDDFKQLLTELIRFKSMHSEPREIQRCAEYIESYLKAHHVEYRRMDSEGVPSIIAVPGSGKTPVILMSHIDVVDATDDQFNPVERDGAIYGRGSLDDKYAAALSLILLSEHLERVKASGGSQKDLPFGVLITGDEEIGGENGARKALAEIDADFCIALDGGGLHNIVVKEKGILRLKISATGKASHGARPWLGENAIDILMRDCITVESFFNESSADHWHRTAVLSRIQGGGRSVNQVPDSAEGLFDVRFTENDDIDDIVETIRRKVRSRIQIDSRGEIFNGGDSPYLDLLLEISPETSVGFEHGASDARFLSEHGIQGIVWGADGDKTAHAVDEHVNLESVAVLRRILGDFFTRLESRKPD
ncbi:MAG TPA: M20 family peptidase [Desulfobacteraceae bacterium]|nr:M20 family peptidase [Desulfobacteraceae bacterium]